ncbi:MAG: hypothetical protein AAGD07_03065 [Planctomycetota bacterium]
MLHIHCDRCDRVLVDDEPRYIVRMEVAASGLGNLQDASSMSTRSPVGSDEEEIDHLSELSEQLDTGEPMESISQHETCGPQPQYDLCEACYRQFACDPVGRSATKTIQFSMN